MNDNVRLSVVLPELIKAYSEEHTCTAMYGGCSGCELIGRANEITRWISNVRYKDAK